MLWTKDRTLFRFFPKFSFHNSYQQLSSRKREVFRLVAQGRTNKEIAEELSLSVRTVERHRSAIMNKIGLQNRAELVAYAVRQGFVHRGDA